MSEENNLARDSKESPAEQQKDVDKDDVIDGIPVVPQEILEKLPPDVRQQIILLLSHQRIGLPPPNPLTSKVTSAHIDKLLDNAEKDSQRDFNSKWFNLAFVVLVLAFLTFVFIYLPTVDKELFKEVLKLLITFLSGLGAGFGLSKVNKKEG